MARLVNDWIDGYVELLDNAEPPLLYKEWVAISVVAACLQRKCYHTWEMDTRIYPNMYIVLVGPPASKKGTTMRPAKAFLDSLGIKVSSNAITREALIRELTGTALPLEGSDQFLHSSMTVFSEEFTVFLGYKNKEMIDTLVDWFDCADRWEYKTKNSGEDLILGVWVNLLAGTTPTALREALPDTSIGGGFTSRIIFVFGDKKHKIVPYPVMTDKERELQQKLLVDLESIRMLRGEFRLTQEFVDAHTEWYIANAKRPRFNTEYLLAYNERRSLHLRKLSMIVNAARTDSMIVTAEDFERARGFLERAEDVMDNAFSGRGSHPKAAIIAEVMKMLREKGELSRKEILETFLHHVTPDDVRNIMAGIVQAGHATLVSDGTEPKLKRK